MATEGGQFLTAAATYLGAAAISIPLFSRFKLGSILGYLAAGVVVGPHVLGLVSMGENVFHIAELGVVLFLFIIGLELSVPRLWALRRDIFGLGAAQMALTGALIAGALMIAGVMPTSSAVIAGFALAFSSTAFALQFMKERGDLRTGYGERAFPILLFQDLAVIPLLAAIPLLTGSGEDAFTWVDGAKMVGCVAALIVVGKYALTPLFHLVAGAGSREAFAATALFIVAATSLAVSWAGLSMALGAFLAGALLAESAYRHQIETDIEPFRGLLLGLFFIAIGMSLDLGLIVRSWPIILGAALGLMALKWIAIFVLTRLFGCPSTDAARAGAVLAQGGEFAFVVFSLGVAGGLFTEGQSTLMAAIITVTMALTPGAMAIADRLAAGDGEDDSAMEGPRAEKDHVLVAGFGRMGQIISQVLQNSGVAVTAIDSNAAHIRNAERFGFKVYFGDAARLDVLSTAGAFDANAVILCMDDAKAVNEAVAVLRERDPALPVYAVAHDRMHEIELRPLEPTSIVRETMESSLSVAREALGRLGYADDLIEDNIEEFRKRDRERLLAQAMHGAEAAKDLLHKPFGASERSVDGAENER
ncbi:MAG: monovalent cation:proton antiporter-2 (CPA2) family protein [Pseudomonadota bacterium]